LGEAAAKFNKMTDDLNDHKSLEEEKKLESKVALLESLFKELQGEVRLSIEYDKAQPKEVPDLVNQQSKEYKELFDLSKKKG
jgi:hypothetical protein